MSRFAESTAEINVQVNVPDYASFFPPEAAVATALPRKILRSPLLVRSLSLLRRKSSTSTQLESGNIGPRFLSLVSSYAASIRRESDARRASHARARNTHRVLLVYSYAPSWNFTVELNREYVRSPIVLAVSTLNRKWKKLLPLRGFVSSLLFETDFLFPLSHCLSRTSAWRTVQFRNSCDARSRQSTPALPAMLPY